MTAPPPAGKIEVNGLWMSPASFARILTALRGLFPDLASLSDQGVIQAVMARCLMDWVADWEARSAADPNAAARQAMSAALDSQQQARTKAHDELTADVQLTVTT